VLAIFLAGKTLGVLPNERKSRHRFRYSPAAAEFNLETRLAGGGRWIRTFRPSRLSELVEPCAETTWRPRGEFLRGGNRCYLPPAVNRTNFGTAITAPRQLHPVVQLRIALRRGVEEHVEKLYATNPALDLAHHTRKLPNPQTQARGGQYGSLFRRRTRNHQPGRDEP
jgi:hypothetical protein